ncbi:MAG TPA: hypothetical protein ENO03_07455 [Candidatus Aminicenantes bacterium]|nr:hypothetical protein [Candidatus Aminicenantes bacterium]HDT14179.1 hypothetical protein [Candidatus Aminicenantes bacterium]
MKKTIGFLLLAAFLGTSCIIRVPYEGSGRYSDPYDNRYDDRYDDYDTAHFYDQLEPYGIWVSHRSYGYVWIPADVGYSWRPYSRGRWAWTDYGWTWVSLERWGWIAFHYGRWGWDARLGWFWVPDIVWGPAWVAWRWGGAHIGWAPLPPGVGFVPGRGFGNHRWDIPGRSWNFVRSRDFMDRRVERWILPHERNMTLIERTDFRVRIDERDRRLVNDGLDLEYVRRQTDRPVERYTLKDATRPGAAREEGRDLVVSRPEIRSNDAAKPKRVLDEARAEREISSETSNRIYRRAVRNEEELVREAHDQERALMRESQEAEVGVIRRRAEEEKAEVRSPEDKKKVDERIAGRLAELKKKHEQEKAELEKRQKAEQDKVKKAPEKKAPVRRKTDKD